MRREECAVGDRVADKVHSRREPVRQATAAIAFSVCQAVLITDSDMQSQGVPAVEASWNSALCSVAAARSERGELLDLSGASTYDTIYYWNARTGNKRPNEPNRPITLASFVRTSTTFLHSLQRFSNSISTSP